MLTPFKLGVGGTIGSGKQWMSWISLDDVVGIINFALEHESVRGAINVVAPNPVTNEEFTKTMGSVLYRPTFLPLPEFAVHMVFGEMGDALLLDSTRVVPKRMLDAGYEFKLWKLNFTASVGVMNVLNTTYISDAQNGINFDATTTLVHIGPGTRFNTALRIAF
jgi:uncharacterized protein (TIGR01777 family)